ncbi:MAG: hypothetical protein KAU17_07280 [Spirochaetales bacterium]|jgi:hypothetical protein|nr:hypothetical protein [Spirochaetales bacterium]
MSVFTLLLQLMQTWQFISITGALILIIPLIFSLSSLKPKPVRPAPLVRSSAKKTAPKKGTPAEEEEK